MLVLFTRDAQSRVCRVGVPTSCDWCGSTVCWPRATQPTQPSAGGITNCLLYRQSEHSPLVRIATEAMSNHCLSRASCAAILNEFVYTDLRVHARLPTTTVRAAHHNSETNKEEETRRQAVQHCVIQQHLSLRSTLARVPQSRAQLMYDLHTV